MNFINNNYHQNKIETKVTERKNARLKEMNISSASLQNTRIIDQFMNDSIFEDTYNGF